MASDVTAVPQDTTQPAIVTVNVARNLNNPEFYGSRPYFANLNGTATTGQQVIRVFANDSDTDVSLVHRQMVLMAFSAHTHNIHLAFYQWH